ncbi:hypothetical protein Pla110_02310 [Polystyrenella longa]|uniref:DUF3137 domain-containing protein n=1 Tax=Polystyrenella longa TaxID=2528007 RepID=A0A518CH25_9PLAN|nr:hypothetical protein [Polystyrenella longa]QDU78527.1 hypothetical protein Pla110_02310 [Polystyrenella longa]
MKRFLFGPSQRKIWSEIAQDIGGDFVEGGFWRPAVLTQEHRHWKLTLDTYTQSSGNTSISYTRLRVPFLNPQDFRFRVYTASIFTRLGELLGMQNINVGDPGFDQKMVVKGDRINVIREVLNHPDIQAKFLMFSWIEFRIDVEKGFFSSKFPEGATQLKFTLKGVLRDQERIKNLFLLAIMLIEQMVKLRHITPAPVQMNVRT